MSGSGDLLDLLSNTLAARVAAAAPLLAAVRLAAGRHVSATLWRADLLLSAELSLPAQDSYTVVLPGGFLGAATLAVRHPALNLAVLRVAATGPATPVHPPLPVRVGALALVLAATSDALPEARLGMVTAIRETPGHEPTILLDLTAHAAQDGGPVLAMDGSLLGIASSAPSGQTQIVSHGAITRALTGRAAAMATAPMPQAAPQLMRGTPTLPGALNLPAPSTAEMRRSRQSGPRAWLGAALQPISLPDSLRGIAGQDTGRKVVRLSPRGPADRAGLRLGDIVLALDGHSVGGTQSIRSLLGIERIGSEVEVGMLREGRLTHIRVLVLSEPGGE